MHSLPIEIASKLKSTPEQEGVVGPIVAKLMSYGWDLNQIVFGKKEWSIPKSPSESTKREKGQSYSGFPVDIAVFDSVENCSDPNHLLFIIECKQESEAAGLSQLEAYYVGEPHAALGIWANSARSGSYSVFLYRSGDGRLIVKKRRIDDLPRPGERIAPDSTTLRYTDLVAPSSSVLRRVIEDLLDRVVMNDSSVNRREDQLDQLCNILLLKLESDREARSNPKAPVFFRMLESEARTARAIHERYSHFVALYPGIFTEDRDRKLRFTDKTISACVDGLSGLKLIELGVSTVSLAFQVLRSEALKQGEGQYFTPQAVIEAGLKLMQLEWKDLILDPACGTGGFLVGALLEIRGKHPNIDLHLTA
jgi:type I restriction enzyme M protein